MLNLKSETMQAALSTINMAGLLITQAYGAPKPEAKIASIEVFDLLLDQLQPSEKIEHVRNQYRQWATKNLA